MQNLFVNSPNALEGNVITKCDTSSAKFQSEEAGLVDGTGTEEEILEEIRSLVCLCRQIMKTITLMTNVQMI